MASLGKVVWLDAVSHAVDEDEDGGGGDATTRPDKTTSTHSPGTTDDGPLAELFILLPLILIRPSDRPLIGEGGTM